MLTDIYIKYMESKPERLEFKLDLPKEDIIIITDALRLRQIMDNLLSNAFKFTSAGRVAMGYTLSSDNKSVRLFVSDTGRGIPADQSEKIFERFYKVDSFVQGAGLGLSICRTIAERLEGSIRVTSREGEGARFTLRLPIHPTIAG